MQKLIFLSHFIFLWPWAVAGLTKVRTALQSAVEGITGVLGVSKLACQDSAEFPRGIGVWYYSVPIFKIQNMCVYYYILKTDPEWCHTRKVPVSQSHLLQLSTGFNASEGDEVNWTPASLLSHKAECAGSSHRLRSQEFPLTKAEKQITAKTPCKAAQQPTVCD